MHGVRRYVLGRALRVPLGIGILLGWLVTCAVLSGTTVRVAHAATTCALQATLPSDLGNGQITGAWSYSTVISQFDSARAAESPQACTVKLEDQFATMNVTSTAWNKATSQQKMLWLFNAERTARGLGSLTIDPNLISRVDYNHSLEMKTYGYFNHPSPINHPGPKHVFTRLEVNPAIGSGANSHWSNLGENIAAGFPDAAQATWAYMYHDSMEGWGHRKNILGGFNWVGIGVVTGGAYGYYYSSDFMQSSNYQRPPAVDTQAPTMAPPTLTCNPNGTLTIRVTPSDSGAATGEAGVSGVVEYVGKVTMYKNGNANTKALKRVSGGTTWTITLRSDKVNLGSIHVVATDGSGNFKDVQSTKSSC